MVELIVFAPSFAKTPVFPLNFPFRLKITPSDENLSTDSCTSRALF